MPRPIPKYASAAAKPKRGGYERCASRACGEILFPAPACPVGAFTSGGKRASQPMQELVHGNLYVNQTYGFQIYKPPTWQVIKDPQNELPNAIGALGTEDQSTLLVIGRDPLKDSLEAQAAKRGAHAARRL